MFVGGGALDAPCRRMLRFRIDFRQIRTVFCRDVEGAVPYIFKFVAKQHHNS